MRFAPATCVGCVGSSGAPSLPPRRSAGPPLASQAVPKARPMGHSSPGPNGSAGAPSGETTGRRGPRHEVPRVGGGGSRSRRNRRNRRGIDARNLLMRGQDRRVRRMRRMFAGLPSSGRPRRRHRRTSDGAESTQSSRPTLPDDGHRLAGVESAPSATGQSSTTPGAAGTPSLTTRLSPTAPRWIARARPRNTRVRRGSRRLSTASARRSTFARTRGWSPSRPSAASPGTRGCPPSARASP